MSYLSCHDFTFLPRFFSKFFATWYSIQKFFLNYKRSTERNSYKPYSEVFDVLHDRQEGVSFRSLTTNLYDDIYYFGFHHRIIYTCTFSSFLSFFLTLPDGQNPLLYSCFTKNSQFVLLHFLTTLRFVKITVFS